MDREWALLSLMDTVPLRSQNRDGSTREDNTWCQAGPARLPSSFPLLFSSYLFLSVPPAEGKDQDLVIRRALQGGQKSLPAVVSRFESDEGNVC